MRSGVRLGVDVGKSRVGVARTDAAGILALPVETLQRSHDDDKTPNVVDRILALAHEYEAVEILVGLPVNLRGGHTPSTEDALTFARALSERAGDIPVRLLDERLSTVSASRALHESGLNTRKQRGVIDQQAAVVLLEQALDIERGSGHEAGRLVSEFPT